MPEERVSYFKARDWASDKKDNWDGTPDPEGPLKAIWDKVRSDYPDLTGEELLGRFLGEVWEVASDADWEDLAAICDSGCDILPDDTYHL